MIENLGDILKAENLKVRVKNNEQLSDDEKVWYRDYLLMYWQDAQAGLAAAKESELKARTAAVDFMRDPAKAGTTENVDLGNGYKATMKTPIRYGFVKAADGVKVNKVAIEKALQKIEKDGEVGELIAERLIKWTPDLSLTEYKLLSPKHKGIIDEVLVTSEGTPTLEIKEPKAK